MPGVQLHSLLKPLPSRETFAESPRTARGIYLACSSESCVAVRRASLSTYRGECWGLEILCLGLLATPVLTQRDRDHGACSLPLESWALASWNILWEALSSLQIFRLHFLSYIPNSCLEIPWSSLVSIIALPVNVAVSGTVLWHMVGLHSLDSLSWVGPNG